MYELNLFPTKLYKFVANPLLVDRIYNEVKNFAFEDNSENLVASFKNYKNNIESYYDDELFQWFDSCLQNICEVYFKDTFNLVINSCWVNKTLFTQTHHKHAHPNSIVSGIFYLNTLETGRTIFYNSNPFTEKLSNTFSDIKNPELSESIKSEAGNLILFPSHLRHSVSANKDKQARYTVSFNTFFNGSLGSSTNKTDLTINTLSVREKFYKDA